MSSYLQSYYQKNKERMLLQMKERRLKIYATETEEEKLLRLQKYKDNYTRSKILKQEKKQKEESWILNNFSQINSVEQISNQTLVM